MKKYRQLDQLKNNLEMYDLYIKEIEDTINLMDSTDDVDVINECKLILLRLKEQILSISDDIPDVLPDDLS